MFPKISIIIPFYNVENYIAKCINSVKNQTFTEFECILIDDESPDASKQVAEQAIQGDKRFRIISQLNKGLGGARNTGLDNAKGEWVVFLDSDDYWERDFLRIMYEKATKYNADIIVCRYKSISSRGEEVGLNILLSEGVYTEKKLLLEFMLSFPTAWNKLYKRELWKIIRFPEKLYYEDLGTIFQLVFNAERNSTRLCHTQSGSI